MLEYFKLILTKVSFSAYLFEKELSKAIKSLINKELAELEKWCYQHFSTVHILILNRYFTST